MDKEPVSNNDYEAMLSLPDLQSRVISLAIKLNRTDLLNDLQCLTEAQWLGAYFMLERLQGS